MDIPIAQVAWCGFRIHGVTPDYVLDCWPSSDYPHGRKGAEMANAWRAARERGAAGMIFMDPDIAADPDDLAWLDRAASLEPGSVHTSLHKLWPASTQRDDWMWSHRPVRGGRPVATQDEGARCDYFAMGMVYIPARLLNEAEPKLRRWQWAQVDTGLSEIARGMNIPCRVVRECRPKHLHFSHG